MQNSNQDPLQQINEDVVVATNKKLNDDRFSVAPTQAHTHNGSDALRIPFQNIAGRFMDIAWALPGTSAATAANYGVFYIAQTPCLVLSFAEVHEVAATDVGTVTLQLEKLTGTTAPGSGTNLLSTALSLKSVANTVRYGTLVKSSYTAIQTNTVFLNRGDRLALKDSGTLTDLVGLSTVTRLQLYP